MFLVRLEAIAFVADLCFAADV